MTARPDPSWETLRQETAFSNTSYASLGESPEDTQNGLYGRGYIFGLSLGVPAGSIAELRLRVQGLMDNVWYDVLAAFPDASSLEIPVQSYTLVLTTASGLVANNKTFRVRLDEAWEAYRLLGQVDTGSIPIGVVGRRI